MAVEVERIKALILQYDDSIQYSKKLLDYNLTEMLLSVIPGCIKNQRMLDMKINEKLKECEQLKKNLETARKKVAKLCSKYEENSLMREFLDFANFISKFRDSNEEPNAALNLENDPLLHSGCSPSVSDYFTEEFNDGDEHESKRLKLQFNNPTDDDRRLNTSTIVSSEDTSTLNSDLRKAYEQLNSEILKRHQAESERNNLEKFSDKLCHLLFKYKKLIDARKTNSQTPRDHVNVKKENDSELNTKTNTPHLNENWIEINENDTFMKRECKFESSPLHIQDDDTTVEIIDSEAILPRNEHHSEVSDETSNSSVWHESQTFDPIKYAESPFRSYDPVTKNIHPIHSMQEDAQKVTFVDLPAHKSQDSSKKNRKSATLQISGVQNDSCNEILSMKSHLKRHVHVKDENLKSHECTICGKRFTRGENLRIHTYEHNAKKRFKCAVCKRRFKHVYNKQKHERVVHGGDVPFQCAHCEHGYFRKNDLVSHIHTRHFSESQKPFKCTICDKSFPLRTYLNKHKVVHMPQRPFKCPTCGKGFKRRNHQKRHEWMVHSKNDCFRCAHCYNVYSLKENLERHLQWRHLPIK